MNVIEKYELVHIRFPFPGFMYNWQVNTWKSLDGKVFGYFGHTKNFKTLEEALSFMRNKGAEI